VGAIESQNLGEVMKGMMEVSGTGCRRRAIPRAGLCAVGAALWRPRRDPARAKPLCRSYAIILAPSLMKLKPTRDEPADIPALDKKFTVDTALTWGGLGPMDFFPTSGFLCHYGFAAWSERPRDKSKS
jgi:hypothetical protein